MDFNIFKISSYIIPLSIAIFANSSIKENKFSKFLSYRSFVWQNTSRGGLPKIFLENMTFEKYADFCLEYPLLFIIKGNDYLFPNNYRFKDFMNNYLKNCHTFNIFTFSSCSTFETPLDVECAQNYKFLHT